MPRTLFRDLLIVAALLALLLLPALGCSHASYGERFLRTPAMQRETTPAQKTFRVRLPDGRQYDVTPVAEKQ